MEKANDSGMWNASGKVSSQWVNEFFENFYRRHGMEPPKDLADVIEKVTEGFNDEAEDFRMRAMKHAAKKSTKVEMEAATDSISMQHQHNDSKMERHDTGSSGHESTGIRTRSQKGNAPLLTFPPHVNRVQAVKQASVVEAESTEGK